MTTHTGTDRTPAKTTSTQKPDQKGKQKDDQAKSSKSAAKLTDDARDDATSSASAAADAARKTVKDASEATIGRVTDKVSETKGAAANRIRESADALHDASSRFPEGSLERETAERIARSLSGAAAQVRSTDLQSVASELEYFARRHPAIFAGCAALVGFAAARAMKASARRSEPDHTPYAPTNTAYSARSYRSAG